MAVNEKREAVRIMTNEGITAINTHIQYTPEKVAVDTDGNVFVVDPSIYQGIVQYDAQDRFLGFFAPNEVKVTADVLFLQMWKKWFSTEQVESMEKACPPPTATCISTATTFCIPPPPARARAKPSST